ncbi:zinc metallopeptidase [bacterium]|nr:zinc metallopeptidase [bacterium]
MFFFDPSIVVLIPAIILALWANSLVKSNYRKYKQVKNNINMTGAEVAMHILQKNGIYDVPVVAVEGELTDRYEPRKREVRLSKDIYYGETVSSVAIAAHEVGHALQHSHKYVPLQIRHAIFPVARFGSTAAFPLFFIGFLFNTPVLMNAGIIFFVTALLFQLVTLPVEFNASQRAFKQLSEGFVVDPNEMAGVKKVLNAAALTYVAAALMSLLQVIRLLVLRNMRD